MQISKCMDCSLTQSTNLFLLERDDVVPKYFKCPSCYSRNVEYAPELDTIPKEGNYLFSEPLTFPDGWVAFVLTGTNYVWFVNLVSPGEAVLGLSQVNSSYFAYVETGVSSSQVNLWSLAGDVPIQLSYHLTILLKFIDKHIKEASKFPKELTKTPHLRGLRRDILTERVSKNLNDTLKGDTEMQRIHLR